MWNGRSQILEAYTVRQVYFLFTALLKSSII